MKNINTQNTILDLPKYIRLARESAIFGFYEKSIEIFKRCLKIVEQ